MGGYTILNTTIVVFKMVYPRIVVFKMVYPRTVVYLWLTNTMRMTHLEDYDLGINIYLETNGGRYFLGSRHTCWRWGCQSIEILWLLLQLYLNGSKYLLLHCGIIFGSGLMHIDKCLPPHHRKTMKLHRVRPVTCTVKAWTFQETSYSSLEIGYVWDYIWKFSA